jgi:hypothetical protein
MFSELAAAHRDRERARREAIRDRQRRDKIARRDNPPMRKALRPAHQIAVSVLGRLRGLLYRDDRLDWWPVGRWEIGRWEQDARAQAHVTDDTVAVGWAASVSVKAISDAEGVPSAFAVWVAPGKCLGGEMQCAVDETALIEALTQLCWPL